MNIGVVLLSDSKYGGMYQYSLSFLKGLLSCSNISIKVFFSSDIWQSHFEKSKKVEYIKINYKKSFNKLIHVLFENQSNPKILWRKVNYEAILIEKSKCDFVFFPAQDSLSYQINSRSVVVVHDIMHRYHPNFSEYSNRIKRVREHHFKNIAKSASYIICESETGKQQFSNSYGFEKERIFILPYTYPPYIIDSTEVDIVAKYNLCERFIFYPAQFWEHKNHENLIRALFILKNRGCIINTVFVGEPKNNYKKVVQLVDQLGLNSQIRMLGYVSDNEMRSLYQKSTMLVYPTQIGPSNIPPLEALYLGVPMAVSNIYEMPDQLGTASLYFNPDDSQDIAEKINILWNDEDLRKRLISNCKQRVERFGIETFFYNLNKIIGEISES